MPLKINDNISGEIYDWSNGKLGTHQAKTKKINLGDRGDPDIQRKEDEERAKRIAAQKSNGTYKADTVERVDIEKIFDDPNTFKDILNDTNEINRKHANYERLRQARENDIKRAKEEAENALNSRISGAKSINGFMEDFEDFIEDHYGKKMGDRKSSYASRNKKNDNSDGLLFPGSYQKRNGEIPSIGVFMDRSNSWSSSRTNGITNPILDFLQEYVEDEKIVAYSFYFHDGVVDVGRDPGQCGGTDCLVQIIDTINSYDLDNVIIITDSDMDGQGASRSYSGPGVVVDGGMWGIFPRYNVCKQVVKYIQGDEFDSIYEM